MAIQVGKEKGIPLTSLIFPRNQVNDTYLNLIKDLGIISYRGTEKSWLYQAKNFEQESSFRRALRLIDA